MISSVKVMRSAGMTIRKGIWISNRHGSSCVLNLRTSIQHRALTVQLLAFSICTRIKIQCMHSKKGFGLVEVAAFRVQYLAL